MSYFDKLEFFLHKLITNFIVLSIVLKTQFTSLYYFKISVFARKNNKIDIEKKNTFFVVQRFILIMCRSHEHAVCANSKWITDTWRSDPVPS